MIINAINYNMNTNFTSWQRTVYKEPAKNVVSKEILYRNDTSFFREDLIWDFLVKFLKDKYSDVSKVNVYDYACSNGSETYSIIMKLLTDLDKKDAEKFFPINAKDIDSLAVSNAKEKSIPISWGEKSRIEYFTNKNFNTYFIKDNTSNWYDGETTFYKPTKALTDRVKFSQADIFKDLKNIERENSVVFARNFWPYIVEDTPKLIDNLSKQLGRNSTLIIGGYDINGCGKIGIDLRHELIKKGFISLDDLLILEKF